MAKSIMIQGTMSNAGKSMITAALCRILKQDGYKTAPFKSQNMALNSFITKEGLEMGRAQVMQAEAAGIEPSVLMNPILLKPTNDTGSQVIVNGEVRGNMSAVDYFKYKRELIPDILKAYCTLEKSYDIIVIEGAGSPAEINLKSEDIVNMGMAKMAKSPVLLVGDIDRGGVFASLAGTLMLLEKEEQIMIKGLIINKFRGDKEILRPGLDMIEEITKKNVIGVIPYIHIDIDDEDSLSDKLNKKNSTSYIDIAIIRFPRISNFTDFNALEYMEGVTVRYVSSVKEIRNADLIILPGTKNTMEDLLWLRSSGLESEILKHVSKQKPVIGICGGYQMLGKEVSDPDFVEHGGQIKGIGILPIKTKFEKEKIRTQTKGRFSNVEGYFSELKGKEFTGYEIHMGVSLLEENANDLSEIIVNGVSKRDGAFYGNVYGTYVHGIFDNEDVAKSIVVSICKSKGLDYEGIKSVDSKKYKEDQYNILADSVRQNLDMKKIYDILELDV